MWPRRRSAGAADDGGFEQCGPASAGADETQEFESNSAETGAVAAAPSKSFSLGSLAAPIGARTGTRAAGFAELEASAARPSKADGAARYKRGDRRGGFGGRKAGLEEPLSEAQVRMRGIALLARREHSRAEMKKKLRRYSEDGELIDKVLDQLQSEKLLSDQRYAESVVRVRGARYGSARVAQDLRNGGVSGELADGLVRELKASDAQRALEAWQKRFGEPAADNAGRVKQMRFLQSRGFSPDIIRKVVPRAKKAAPEEFED